MVYRIGPIEMENWNLINTHEFFCRICWHWCIAVALDNLLNHNTCTPKKFQFHTYYLNHFSHLTREEQISDTGKVNTNQLKRLILTFVTEVGSMSTATVRTHRVKSSGVPRVLPIQESSVGMFRVRHLDFRDRGRWLLLGFGKADSFSSAPPGNLLCQCENVNKRPVYFGVFSTVHHSIELFHQATLMHNFLYSLTICLLHYCPRNVSSINMPIFRRKNCIHTASGIFALRKRLDSTPVESGLTVYCAVLCTVQTFTESEDTRCCVNTIFLLKMGMLMLETCRG